MLLAHFFQSRNRGLVFLFEFCGCELESFPVRFIGQDEFAAGFADRPAVVLLGAFLQIIANELVECDCVLK